MEEPRRKARKFSDFALNTDRNLGVFETKVTLPPNRELTAADVGVPSPATARQVPELTEPAAGIEVTKPPSPDRKVSSPSAQSVAPSENAEAEPGPDKGESIAISARIPADVYLSMRRATRLREKQNDFIISALKREIASRE
jgi:hypothetical protein